MEKRINNVLEYLENSAKRHPDKIAFADEHETVTYSELVQKARGIASFLARKTKTGNPVAVLGEKSVQTITVFFACVYAGCFYVPLNPLHPTQRREQILQTLGSPLILVQKECRNLLPDSAGNIYEFDEISSVCNNSALEEIKTAHTDINPLYVMFTSGSTGTPKGIAVSHRSVIDFTEEFTGLFDIGENDVIGNQAPFDFDVSVKDVYATIKTGATMQIISKKKFSVPTALMDYLIERNVTTLIWAVSALCILSTFHVFQYKIPVKINKVLFSGEVMPVKHLNEWKKHLPAARFVNLYGPTEITCNCTYYPIAQGEFTESVLPIGKPFPNERVFLLDENNSLITDKNKAGEICVSGTALSLGYYNNKTETEKAFVQNPLNDAYLEKIYKTGDLAYYDTDGYLCFIGRKDFQVKHMGHRIELSEIESAMIKTKNVLRALCIYDEAKSKIWAFYQGSADHSELLASLRSLLPAYMVPHKCVQIAEFDLTENGKIDRKKLREKYII